MPICNHVQRMNFEILKYTLIITGAVFLLYLFDRLFLWFESKGWIYYRHKKSSVGAGNALQSLNAVFTPSAKYMIQVQEKSSQSKESLGDNKDL